MNLLCDSSSDVKHYCNAVDSDEYDDDDDDDDDDHDDRDGDESSAD